MRSKPQGAAAGGQSKSASVKAMELLLYKPRTEKELRDRLAEKAYPEEEIEEALRYVKSYGYLNDEAYAEQYVSIHSAAKGKNALRMELRKKGIDAEQIEAAVSGIEEEEEEVIYRLLLKKAGDPHETDEKEYRRLFGFCARRGFSAGKIHKALRSYNCNTERD